jgi:hypothetical protein
MKKGYEGDEIWSAVSPVTGKQELIDPEGEFIPVKQSSSCIIANGWTDTSRCLEHRYSKSRATVTRSKPLAKTVPHSGVPLGLCRPTLNAGTWFRLR